MLKRILGLLGWLGVVMVFAVEMLEFVVVAAPEVVAVVVLPAAAHRCPRLSLRPLQLLVGSGRPQPIQWRTRLPLKS